MSQKTSFFRMLLCFKVRHWRSGEAKFLAMSRQTEVSVNSLRSTLCQIHQNYPIHESFFFLWRYSPNLGLDLPPWNSPFHFGFLDLGQSVGLLGRVTSSSHVHKHRKTHTHTQTLNIHALGQIRTHDPGFRASEDSERLNRSATVTGHIWVIGNLIYSMLLTNSSREEAGLNTLQRSPASHRKRRKGEPGAWGYNWATVIVGHKHRDLVPRLGIGSKADDLVP
jgi:hypothetical protein